MASEAEELRREWMRLIWFHEEEIDESINRSPPIDAGEERQHLEAAKRMSMGRIVGTRAMYLMAKGMT